MHFNVLKQKKGPNQILPYWKYRRNIITVAVCLEYIIILSLSGEKEQHDPVEAIVRINCRFMLKSFADKTIGPQNIYMAN